MRDKPLRILYVCDEYPPESPGGFGIFVKELAHHLCHKRHQVFVYGWYSSVHERTELRDGPVQVIKDKKVSGLNYLKEIKEYGKAISKLAKELNIDTVEMTDSAGKFLFVKHPNLCVRLHTSTRYFKRRSLKMDLIERAAFAFRRAKIIAVSGYIQHKFESYYKLVNPSSSLEVVYNGVEIKRIDFMTNKKNKSIVFGGTVKPLKGLDLLIEAFFQSELWKQGYTLDIYGKETFNDNEKSYSSQLKSLALSKSKEFENCVHLRGEVSKAELMEKFSQSFVNVFPSRSESFGLVVVESMLHGALTVFTKQGAANELIYDKVDGFLFDVDDSNQLKNLLIEISNMDNEDLISIRKHAIRKAEEFSIDKCAKETLKVYRR